MIYPTERLLYILLAFLAGLILIVGVIAILALRQGMINQGYIEALLNVKE